MKSIKKLILFIALIFIAFVSAWMYFFKAIDKPTTSPIQNDSSVSTSDNKEENKVTVTLDYQDGRVDTYSYDYWGEKSAFEATQEVLNKENISYESKQYDFGVFVKSINGLASSEDKAWIYFVNGKSASVGADSYTLSDGDKIEWKYITPSE